MSPHWKKEFLGKAQAQAPIKHLLAATEHLLLVHTSHPTRLLHIRRPTQKKHMSPNPSTVEDHTECFTFTTDLLITITLSVTCLHCTVSDTTMVMAGTSIITVEVTTLIPQLVECKVLNAEETLLPVVEAL